MGGRASDAGVTMLCTVKLQWQALLLMLVLAEAISTAEPKEAAGMAQPPKGALQPSKEAAAMAMVEREALLEFRASATSRGKKIKNQNNSTDSTNWNLSSWSTAEDHCSGSWYGIKCSRNGRVTHIILDGLRLAGPIDSLRRLPQLRVVSLCNNDLNGTLDSVLSHWRLIKSLYLCRNRFNGQLPDTTVSRLTRLVRLDLSDNLLTGPFPSSLASLPRLLTISLQNNNLSGTLPNFTTTSPPYSLQRFNVSGNQLSGAIPVSLSNFSITSFLGNDGLCGTPLLLCSSPPAASVLIAAPESSPNVTKSENKSKSNLKRGIIAAIVVGDIAVIALLLWFFVLYYCRRYEVPDSAKRTTNLRKTNKKLKDKDQKLLSNYPVPEGLPQKARKLVFVDAGGSNYGNFKQFELDDLLKASAEMIGKGSYGTAYKAILSDRRVVAVKRLNESMAVGRKDFEQTADMAAKLRHTNLVSLRAYCFGKDEKLLVYDFMPAGNLHTLLHGNRGPARTPLDWTTRVKIASGAARGLAFIHHHFKPQRLVHGNIKSSNVLLDKDGNACISDFGLVHMANSSGLPFRLNGYRAPECLEFKKTSQAGDVYSFGVLLLEILTGKVPTQSQGSEEGVNLPRWVQSVVQEQWTAEVFDLELLRYKDIEEEMVALLQIAMACVANVPEHRPRMTEVTKMIEGIFGEHQSFQRGESFDSISMSPSVSEDTTTSH